ncbi:MAG: DUF4238 domain-containing protein, partial [Pseudomonadota bacterium]
MSSNQKKEQLTVIDLKQKKLFETNIKNIGGKRDFNTAKIEGKKSSGIETALSQVEAIIASGLRQIEKDRNLSSEESNAKIFNLMALLVARNPSSRSNHIKFQKQIFKQFSNIMVSKKDIFESLQKRSKLNECVSYERMKEFIQSDRNKIEVPNECCIPLEFEAFDVILPHLFNRGWILVISSDQTGPFVTSNNPVVLTWKYPEKIPPFYRWHPGFGVQDTMVQFPISKHLAMIGEFGFTDTVCFADKNYVSLINRTTMNFASPQVYSPDLNFYFKNTEGEITLGSDIFNGEVVKDSSKIK